MGIPLKQNIGVKYYAFTFELKYVPLSAAVRAIDLSDNGSSIFRIPHAAPVHYYSHTLLNDSSLVTPRSIFSMKSQAVV